MTNRDLNDARKKEHRHEEQKVEHEEELLAQEVVESETKTQPKGSKLVSSSSSRVQDKLDGKLTVAKRRVDNNRQ